MRRPIWLVALVALAALGVVVASVAARSMENSQAGTTTDNCAPRPCAAPSSFEIYISDVAVAGGRATMAVRFTNQKPSVGFEAVSYRHTSPVDFSLRTPDGTMSPPAFSADCPNWPEVRVERGATSDAYRLCFATTAISGLVLIWDPDLGIFPHRTEIALN
jgi:hypothetical protein